MRKSYAILAIVILLMAVIAFAAYSFFQSLTNFPTSEQADISFQTIASNRPDDSSCLNQAGEAGVAKELIDMMDKMVIANSGDKLMPDDVWAEYNPFLPWLKNSDRHTMFSNHCFYRSPDTPVDCEGDECQIMREVAGYTWVELSAIESLDCYPSDAGCSGLDIPAGAVAVIVTRKCHQIIFEDDIYELVSPTGDRYVMHATTGTPNLYPELPEGWTLSYVELDEPLEILPFGGGDNCYHNILRDNLEQAYHQYIFANEQYP